MEKPIKDLASLLQNMTPVLKPGIWAFVSVPRETSLEGLEVLATFRESEGLTLVIPEEIALARNFVIGFRYILINLCSNL
jgi:hypothetical protein